MKLAKQFLIILFVTFLGEVLNSVIPLPVPASIYGLVLMLAGLKSGIIPLDSVKDAGGFLIEIMPMMFIPAAAGILVSWVKLKEVFLPIVGITIITTVLVMAVTGWVTQKILTKKENINA